ncbi:MAG TPA: hypothetical protein VFL47_04925, partial [Flavisolibacter sp.]|nr:hypothetical protein [Flavisolibacter sp.]
MKKMYRVFPFLLLFFFTVLRVGAASPLQPDVLTCEYLHNPLGIAEQKPRLTWTLKSSQRNQRQTAYEILVSDN